MSWAQQGEVPEFLASAITSRTDECIVWPHSNNGTHPTMTIGGTNFYAHRIACIAKHGAPPPGMVACHLCGDSLCVNPRHLLWESQADNCARISTQVKLTAVQVLAIRADYRWQTEIAAEYGVSQSTISAIKRRKRWGHLPDAEATPALPRDVPGSDGA